MKARLAWLAGGIGVGVAAGYRALRARAGRLPPPEEQRPDARAEELRRKLAEARAAVDEREEFEAAETPVDEVGEVLPPAAERPVPDGGAGEGVPGEPGGAPAPGEPQTVDERRRRVHERAKASARKMRGREPEA